jgi:hypothetical protein
MMTRAEAVDLLDDVKTTLMGDTVGPRTHIETRNSIYLSCIATTMLVIAHTIIENPYPDI